MPYLITDPAAQPIASPPPPAQDHGKRPPFVEMAVLGRNEWWRYLLALFSILLVWFVICIVLVSIGYAWDENIELVLNDPAGFAPTYGPLPFVVVMLSIASLLPATCLAVRVIHRRPMWSVLTGRAGFGWQAFAVSTAVTLATCLGVSLAWTLVKFGSINYDFDFQPVLRLLPFILLLVPLQAAAEEVLFRGYILQGIARLTRSWGLRLIVPAALFVAVHVTNPEFTVSPGWAALNLGILALYLGFLTLRTNGLEHAIGIHTGLNIWVSALQVMWGPGLAFEYDGEGSVPYSIILYGVHYFVVIRWLCRESGDGNGPRRGPWSPNVSDRDRRPIDDGGR